MNKAPLLLERYFLTDLRLVTRHEFDPKRKAIYKFSRLLSDVKYLVNEKHPGVWMVPLHLKYESKSSDNVPYSFSINIVGFFRVHEEYPKDKAEDLIHINAPAMLFGAAREVIGSISGRGPWGPILLPSVNFIPKKKKGSLRTVKRKTKKKRT